MSTPVNSSATELYFEYYEIHVYWHGRKTPAYLSAENKIVFSQFEANWFETAAEAYRKIKRLPKGMGLFVVEKIIEYPDLGPPTGPCPDFIKKILNDIPLPYSLTAVSWYEGIDVRREAVVFGTLPKSTYYRHRKKLFEYGIDISKKCTVRLIR
ncbi:phage X family protein [mine drainage metagenome]|uniref:Phage X family protein n=1 Tax=mine drainage metagenome TaxID=410659 RepID=A0A1J5SJK6_9ZZZZ